MAAAATGHSDAFKVLLEAGANIEITDKVGYFWLLLIVYIACITYASLNYELWCFHLHLHHRMAGLHLYMVLLEDTVTQ